MENKYQDAIITIAKTAALSTAKCNEPPEYVLEECERTARAIQIEFGLEECRKFVEKNRHVGVANSLWKDMTLQKTEQD